MKPSWSASLPLVSVPQSDQPKAVTLVYPYYESPQFLRTQVGWWNTFPSHIKAHLSAIVVDDGSPVSPASDVLQGQPQPFPLRLFRIHEDRRWNWLAARNIGAHHANDGWIVLTDMDHVLPQSTAEALIYGQHDAGTVYGFSRMEHTGEPLEPHKNSWLLTKERFWAIGGYDEELSGLYGTDGDMRRRMAKAGPMAILQDRLIRHEYQGDSSTTAYKRKQPEDAQVARLVAARGRGWKPKTLSFPYEEVALKVAA